MKYSGLIYIFKVINKKLLYYVHETVLYLLA